MPARISASFAYHDRNHSGFLDYRELRAALRHYGLDLSTAEAMRLVARYDDQPDGKLEYAEFAELIRDLEQQLEQSASRTKWVQA